MTYKKQPQFLLKEKDYFIIAKDKYEPHNEPAMGPIFGDYATIELTPTKEKVNLGELILKEVQIIEDKFPCGNPILSKVQEYAKEKKYDCIFAGEKKSAGKSVIIPAVFFNKRK